MTSRPAGYQRPLLGTTLGGGRGFNTSRGRGGGIASPSPTFGGGNSGSGVEYGQQPEPTIEVKGPEQPPTFGSPFGTSGRGNSFGGRGRGGATFGDFSNGTGGDTGMPEHVPPHSFGTSGAGRGTPSFGGRGRGAASSPASFNGVANNGAGAYGEQQSDPAPPPSFGTSGRGTPSFGGRGRGGGTATASPASFNGVANNGATVGQTPPPAFGISAGRGTGTPLGGRGRVVTFEGISNETEEDIGIGQQQPEQVPPPSFGISAGAGRGTPSFGVGGRGRGGGAASPATFNGVASIGAGGIGVGNLSEQAPPPPAFGTSDRGTTGYGRGRGGGVPSFNGGGNNEVNAGQQSELAPPTPSFEIPSSGYGSSFGGRGRGRGGGFAGSNQTEGGDSAAGTDFGDSGAAVGRGGRGRSATGANTAPLGVGGRGAFGRGGGGLGGFAAPRNDDNHSESGSSTNSFSARGRGRGGPSLSASGIDVGRGGGGRGRGGGGDSTSFGGGGIGGRGGGSGATFGNRDDYQQQQERPTRNESNDRGEEADQNFKRPYFGAEGDMGHVPVDRKIDEVFEEDLKVSGEYKTIAEEDEECVVTGLPHGDPTQQLDTWENANFEPQLMANIQRAQYIKPRKIQALSIPLIMDGHDIKGLAETGSGKSAAFLLPIINQIIVKKKQGDYQSKRICPYALIIEPTRELVYQVYDQARKFTDGTGVSVSKAYGKFVRKENLREISTNGCDILVGTPGRLTDFFVNNYLEFVNMKILVLDEADSLLEDEFARELRVLSKCKEWPKNEDRQTVLFSATFPPEVQEWAADWMKKDNVMVSNTKMVEANTRVIQKFMLVPRAKKNEELVKMLLKEVEEAKQADPANPTIKRTMVFVRMKRSSDVISNYVNVNQHMKSTTINGDRTQKLREEALNGFRTGAFNVIVTTDVCARGIDIKDLDHVINLDLPMEYITYVHRIGRTGRLKEGMATTFFDPAEDMSLAGELVQGCYNVGQEPPEWLVKAARGELPPMEDEQPPYEGGWGQATSTTQQPSTSSAAATDDNNNGGWGPPAAAMNNFAGADDDPFAEASQALPTIEKPQVPSAEADTW